MTVHLSPTDWVAFAAHFALLSLLAVGGAIATAPDMHRYLVDEQAWLSDAQFSTGIALAQAAPGPNVLFVALLGWQVGVNACGGVAVGWHAWPLGMIGVVLSMVAMLLPSSVLTYGATQWAHRNQHLLAVKAFKVGLAPLVVSLMLATAWLMAAPARWGTAAPWLAQPWVAWGLSVFSALVIWKTRVHMLWLLGAGAAAGAMGWV